MIGWREAPPTHVVLLVALEPAIVNRMIAIGIAVALLGGPLGLLMLRSRRSRRLGRGEVSDAIDVAAGWRHLHGG